MKSDRKLPLDGQWKESMLYRRQDVPARPADSVKRVDCYFRSRDRASSLHRLTHTRELSQQCSGTFYVELPIMPEIYFPCPSRKGDIWCIAFTTLRLRV